MDNKSKILKASRAILKSMPQFAYVFNKENKLVMWNKNLEKLLGYTAEELWEKDAFDFMEEEVREINTEAISKVFNEKVEQSLEQYILTKDGKKIPVIDTANYAVIDGEEYLVGMAIDISDMKKMQQKLEAQIIKTNKLQKLLEAENIDLKKEIGLAHDFGGIIGEDKKLLKALFQIKQVAKTGTAILFQGEIGTRKAVFARALHQYSNRSEHPFIKINCASFTGADVEKEFYAYMKKVFVEVDKSETGRFKTLNKATLFFEEIDLLPLDFQPKLVSYLQNQRIELNTKPGVIHLDVRVVASTSKDFDKLLRKHQISKELYYFLNIFPIHIPPLRERKSDIPLLVQKFMAQYNRKYGKQVSKVANKSMKMLQSYSWPGNVKELENVIERAVILSNSSLLKVEAFIPEEEKETKKLLSLNDFEREYIIKILNLTYWKVAGEDGAAKILGLHPETLRSKMRKLNISKHDNIKYNVFR